MNQLKPWARICSQGMPSLIHEKCLWTSDLRGRARILRQTLNRLTLTMGEKKINWKENPMKNSLWKVDYWWRPPYNVLSALSGSMVPRRSTVNSIWVCDALEWRWWKYLFSGRRKSKKINYHHRRRPNGAEHTWSFAAKATYGFSEAARVWFECNICVVNQHVKKKWMEGIHGYCLASRLMESLAHVRMIPKHVSGHPCWTELVANRLPASLKTPGGCPVKQRCPWEPFQKEWILRFATF